MRSGRRCSTISASCPRSDGSCARSRSGWASEVHLACEASDERLDPDLETLVYRVTQEALTNAAKYADSPNVKLTLERSGARLRLLVEDHGCGFDVDAALAVAASDRGFGLRAMRDRVQLFGGRFQVTSAPGRGTTIEVEVPL